MSTAIARQVDHDAFFRHIEYRPHAGQRPVHDSQALYRILACGARFGKTTAAAAETSAAALEPLPSAVGWVVAPTRELASKVWREVHRIFVEKFPHRISRVREYDMDLRVINLAGGICEIRGKTADNPKNLLGEGLDWLVIDEAARIKEVIWNNYLSQRLIDKRGWAMLISTPKGKGWFYDFFRAGQEGPRKRANTESWNMPSYTNPRLSREALEELRLQTPELAWRQEILAEFIEGAGAVFRKVREAAVGEWCEPFYTVPDRYGMVYPDTARAYYAGLDLAKTQDYTVLVILDDLGRVVFFDRFRRQDWAVQVQRLKVALDYYGSPRVMVDSTGKGEPVYEQLLAAGVNAAPYLFTNASKAALVNNLALLLEQGRLTLPRVELCPVLVDELESFEYHVTDAGNVTSSAPPGQHDDAAIGLALACWCWNQRHYESVDRLAI